MDPLSIISMGGTDLSDWIDEWPDEDLDAELSDFEDEDPAEDISLSRTMTQPAFDGHILQERLDSLGSESPVARDLISQTQRMQQTLGDADATVAELGADIEATLRLHFLEFQNNPAAVLLAVLSRMPPARQWQQIEQCVSLLEARKARLWSNTMCGLAWVPPVGMAKGGSH